MERLWTIIKKEFFHIWRDPITLALLLALPGVLLVLLGYGITYDSKNIPMAVADFSKTDASRELIEKFTETGDFKLKFDVLSTDDLLDLIDQDQADVALLIPEYFGRNVDTNEPVKIQFFINGAIEPTEIQTIQLKISALSSYYAQEILIEQISRSGQNSGLALPIEGLTKILYNPDSDSQLFMIPGLIPIILQVQALILSAFAIVREREQGTMEQLIVTPVKSWELMLGKSIPYLILSMANMFVLLWLGEWLFGISVAGSYWGLIGMGFIFILGSLGMGVLISNLSRTQMQAMYLAIFVVLIPAIILSGMLFPRDNMPLVTLIYSELLPVTHFLEITRGVILRGAEMQYLWNSIMPLIVLSIFYFAVSILVFRKRL